MGKEGILAEHPTLKLKYSDPDMAKAAQELTEKLNLEREAYELRHKEGVEEGGLVDADMMSTEGTHDHHHHIDHKATT